MAVRQQIPVLMCVRLILGPGMHPGGTPALEEGAPGIVHQRPPGPGEETLPHGDRPLHPVQGPDRSPQVPRGGFARPPRRVHVPGGHVHLEVGGPEAPAPFLVAEPQGVGLDDEPAVLRRRAELRHVHAAVHHNQRGMVLEAPVRRPLHAHQPVGEEGEAGVTGLHHGGGARGGNAALLGSKRRGERRSREKRNEDGSGKGPGAHGDGHRETVADLEMPEWKPPAARGQR